MLRAPQGIAADQRALREWLPVLTIAIALTLSCPAGADVQVKHKTTSEGLGGFGNSTAEDVTVISGDRARIDTGMTVKELATKLEDAADSKVKEQPMKITLSAEASWEPTVWRWPLVSMV